MVPLTYDPPLKPGEELSFVRQDKPDAPDLVRGWLQAEPARKLPKLAKVPILIVVAEASYHAAYDHCTAAYLTQAGVRNTFVRLDDIGIRGNGHMMMLEKNSDEIAGVIEGWLKKTLAKTPKARRALAAKASHVIPAERARPDRSRSQLLGDRRRGFRVRARRGMPRSVSRHLSRARSWPPSPPFLRRRLLRSALLRALFFPLPHSSLLASRAPSTSASSFAHCMVGWTRR